MPQNELTALYHLSQYVDRPSTVGYCGLLEHKALKGSPPPLFFGTIVLSYWDFSVGNCSLDFSSVKSSLRWYVSALESPYALRSILQNSPHCVFGTNACFAQRSRLLVFTLRIAQIVSSCQLRRRFPIPHPHPERGGGREGRSQQQLTVVLDTFATDEKGHGKNEQGKKQRHGCRSRSYEDVKVVDVV